MSFQKAVTPWWLVMRIPSVPFLYKSKTPEETKLQT
jgi:hypothetical protein